VKKMENMDALSEKKLQLMMERATRNLRQDIITLNEKINSMGAEMGSLKSQFNRIQLEDLQNKPSGIASAQAPSNAPSQVQQQSYDEDKPRQNQNLTGQVAVEASQQKPEVVDCRPKEQQNKPFVSGAEKNSQDSAAQRYGNYTPEDVSIDQFFYFGKK
jgi:CDGSH-type Zn-finger protein